jgi:Domain of unknown function (DUF1929)
MLRDHRAVHGAAGWAAKACRRQWVSIAAAFVVVSGVVSVMHAPPAAANPGALGSWSAPGAWPLIGIHAVLTPQGKVVTYGSRPSALQTGLFEYDVWDPSGAPGVGHTLLPNQTQTDLFCNLQIVMPENGNVLMASGDIWDPTIGRTLNVGNDDVNVLDSNTNVLSLGGKLNRKRWYATPTTLPSGHVYIAGGKNGEDRAEVRAPNGEFMLTTIDTSGDDWYYPRAFVLPNGRLFGFDVAGHAYLHSADFATRSYIGDLPSENIGWTSSAVMYEPGKVLVLGGQNNPATFTVDMTSGSMVTAPAGTTGTLRLGVSSTLLADGKVLATGGSEVWNELVGVNNTAQIWDPATRVWSTLAAGTHPRLYHSTALLLPDARVLVAGGGAPGPRDGLDGEIFSPPYLFTAAGTPAPRPVITTAPTLAETGSTMSLGLGSAAPISKVTLLKTGSVTHSVNFDQRFVPATFSQSGATLSVQLPNNPAVLTPGAYMVYVWDAAGVPSVAKIFRVPPRVVAGPYGFLTGGMTGSLFVDNAAGAVTGIDVWADTKVNAVRLRSANATGPVRGAEVGVHTALTLAANERVIEISGRGEIGVGQLTIKTNLRTVGPLGDGGGPPFRFTAPGGFEISSLRGRVGASSGVAHPTALGISIRPISVVGGEVVTKLQPLEPGRLLDSRPGGATVDGGSARIGERAAGSVTQVQIVGRHNIPADASAVVLSVTVAEPTSAGYVTVWPCGSSPPNASNVNFAPGQTIANAVLSKIGADGQVCIFTSAATHVLADTTGYYLPGALQALTPGRLLDSRPGGTTVDDALARIGVRGAGSTTEVQVTGRHGVPASATAVALNVTVTDPAGPGFVTVWPCGTAPPNASTVNFRTRQTIANVAISKVGAGGRVCIFTSAATHLLADITGHYPAGSLTSLDPVRLLDSRPGSSTVDGAMARIGARSAGSTTEVQVTGRAGVPAEATSVVLNLTVTDPASAGYITVWPCGTAPPNASNVNYGGGQTIANAVISKIGTQGRVCVYTQTSAHLIADITAYDG